MDSDGYTTPPTQGNDGMCCPEPHTTKTHHGYGGSTSGGYGHTGGSTGGGYGHTSGGYGPTPTPTATVAVPTTPPASLPVTSAPAGGHVDFIVGMGAVTLALGIGLVRASMWRRRTHVPQHAAG